ncbi:hypothetical protein JZ751_023355 [Albula glossodonta]|uniref:Uncharacterized protein n=1 Tax=Albula glossodonta TaxID=121402 RepID=A0A8T2NHH6_9TELE|nr:hypothetical protein JZ751_023355 [Albula glossodonta]
MEFLEVLTEGLNRVLLVRGGGLWTRPLSQKCICQSSRTLLPTVLPFPPHAGDCQLPAGDRMVFWRPPSLLPYPYLHQPPLSPSPTPQVILICHPIWCLRPPEMIGKRLRYSPSDSPETCQRQPDMEGKGYVVP